MNYSALIRKLVLAAEAAKREHTDVADVLRDRCISGASPVRQMLMNAVCDPRFKLHVDAVPDWRRKARAYLEGLANRVSALPNVTVEEALEEMGISLNLWLERMCTTSGEDETSALPLDNSVNDTEGDAEDLDEETRELLGLLQNIKGEPVIPIETDKKEKKAGEGEEQAEEGLIECDTTPSDDDRLSRPYPTIDCDTAPRDEKINNSRRDENQETISCDTQPKDREQIDTSPGMDNPTAVIDGYFKTIPPSLVQLAKLIGRTSLTEDIVSGKFLKASKCDISGITVGNDLNSLLPSELALMADSSTQDVFFRRYAEKSLQLFATASQSNSGKEHKDGPIVVCLDTSGSMSGKPVAVARAVAYAVCVIAQRRKRKVIVIRYADSHDEFYVHNLVEQKEGLVNFLNVALNGGNNEENLFQFVFKDLLPNQNDFSSADLLCVSDFGWGYISDETVELINEAKKKDLRIYGLNISSDTKCAPYRSLYNGHDSDVGHTPEDICDSLWEFKDKVCKRIEFMRL